MKKIWFEFENLTSEYNYWDYIWKVWDFIFLVEDNIYNWWLPVYENVLKNKEKEFVKILIDLLKENNKENKDNITLLIKELEKKGSLSEIIKKRDNLFNYFDVEENKIIDSILTKLFSFDIKNIIEIYDKNEFEYV